VHGQPEEHVDPLTQVGYRWILNALINQEQDQVKVQETSHKEEYNGILKSAVHQSGKICQLCVVQAKSLDLRFPRVK